MAIACITGASVGFGRALAHSLAGDGWSLVVDARHGAGLESLDRDRVTAITGDVTDAAHRSALAAAAGERLDLLVLNAGTLGPSPLPTLEHLSLEELRQTLETNVVAQVGLAQALLPALRRAGGVVIGLSSDAAREPYETWGAYGASKAALDQLLNVLGAEEASVAVYAFDPGDMRTAMHQAAFPGQDISDRPLPEASLPPLRRLLALRPQSGRYRATDLLEDGQG
ncbi:MAG: SDR family NAD(P)-dependent oxidoreductase [Candidatus Dormibacteraceae bacterium]